MASTSLTGSTRIKYDVFINFRGRDTRKNFTSHLCAALERNGIDAFTDKGLEGGEEISDTLLTRISKSQVSVVIFSPNYADSRWCLDELVKINQCKEENRQAVLPVFLGVEPTHVRKQTDAFGKGFRKLLGDHQYVDKVESWRCALQQTANLSGWDSNQTSEGEIIEQLLKRIQNILSNMTSDDSDHNFIGIRRVEEVESLLFLPNLNSLGLWGMGGSGKTTLAKKVFNRISYKFDALCFVENVSDIAKRCGPNHLRKYMLSQILGKSNIDKGPHIFSGDIRRKLQRIKVLIILDDVGNSQQLETIIGECGYYCPGSKIIATSRDKRVLTNGCQRTYEVKTLDHEEALQLLKLHIFKQRQPTVEHMQLLGQAIKYTQGLPLALVVLGRNLYDKDVRYWKSELAKISDIPDMQITEILRTSFDGLEKTEKSIFLDVACLLKGWNKDRVESILDVCGFYAIRGIDRLVDKALVIIDSNQRLQMHNLLQQMGQHIALDECIRETGVPSRLWMFKDIIEVLTKNRGTKTMSRIEVMSLDLSKATNVQLKSEVFKKMRRLRVLRFHSASSVKVRMLLPEGLNCLPDTLRYFRWDVYPLPTLPRTFASENLVEFRMVDSHLKQLWSSEVEPFLPNLKTIDLSGSKNLVRLPNFKNVLKLETLQVPYCKKLKKVPDSLQHLVELKHIVFHGNKSLPRLPKCSTLMNLEIISLLGCSGITKLPKLPPSLAFLNLSHTAIKELPSSIGCLSQLEYLNLCDCKELESLPSGIGELKHLQELDLGGCPKLLSLPASLGELKSLVRLMIYGSPLKSLSPSINHLSRLNKLILVGYKGDTLPSLRGLVSLETLDLRRSGFKSLHEDIKYLSNLWRLNLSDCKCLSFLPELPSRLQFLDAFNCTSLVKYTPSSLHKHHQRSNVLGNGLRLQFNNCFNLEGDERNKIISDFWQKIKLFSVSVSRRLETLLCFPASEVPKWFKYSNIGSSIQVKKTNHKRMLDFYGLAFCIVVAFSPNLNLTDVSASCSFLTESGKRLVSSGGCYCAGHEGTELQTEHLILWHDYFGPSHFYFTEASFQFSVVCFDFLERVITNDLEIVNCGVTPFGIKCGASGLPSVGKGNYREERGGLRLLKKSKKRKQRIQGDQEVRPCHKRPKNLEILHDQNTSKQKKKKKKQKGNQSSALTS